MAIETDLAVGTVTTTDGTTWSNLLTFTVREATAVNVTVETVGLSGTNGTKGHFSMLARRATGGSVTIPAALDQATFDSEGAMAGVVAYQWITSGTDTAILQVKGVASTSIVWNAFATLRIVS
jgi:hypothetical protein